MVLMRFNESKFASKLIFIGLETMLISFCNLVLFELVISILVSSADTTGVALLTKPLVNHLYKRNKKRPKIDPFGTQCFTLAHLENMF
jgi:hypothetical protein